jgi:hypothetical protein
MLNSITLCYNDSFIDADTVIEKNISHEIISLLNDQLFSRHALTNDFKTLSLGQQAHLKREH